MAKEIVLLLLCVTVFLTSGEQIEDQDSKNILKLDWLEATKNLHQRLPHEVSCSHFYVIGSDGGQALNECPDGQLFDPRTLRCRLKTEVQCWSDLLKRGLSDNKLGVDDKAVSNRILDEESERINDDNILVDDKIDRYPRNQDTTHNHLSSTHSHSTRRPGGSTNRFTTRRPWERTRHYHSTRSPWRTRDRYNSTRHPWLTTDRYNSTRRPWGTTDRYNSTRRPWGTTHRHHSTRRPWGTTHRHHSTRRSRGSSHRHHSTRRPWGRTRNHSTIRRLGETTNLYSTRRTWGTTHH